MTAAPFLPPGPPPPGGSGRSGPLTVGRGCGPAAGEAAGRTDVAVRTTPTSRHDHGDARRYRDGCRCPDCTWAISRYQKDRIADRTAGRPRTLSNVGALRRVQALRALGWPARVIADRIGVHERNLCRWPHRRWISRRLYERICAVYDELSMTTGPDVRARRHAERQGWPPPLAWDDETIDDPDARPFGTSRSGRTHVGLREDELFLRTVGCSEHEIARRLGVSVAALERKRLRGQAVAS